MAQLASFRLPNAFASSGTQRAFDETVLVTQTRRDCEMQSQPTQHEPPPSPSHANSVDYADMLQNLVLPWSFQPLVIGTEIHEVRPVVLERHEVPTRSDRQRLTSFGVHWENLRVSASGQVSCACCDAVKATVDEYRETVSLMYRRWITSSAPRRAKWQRQGCTPAEIEAKTVKLRRTLFPRGGFFNETMASASDGELMAYVCSYSDMSHSFHVSATDEPTSFRWISVFDAGMRLLCRQLLQPFRAQAERTSTPVTRSHVRLRGPLCHEEEQDEDTRDQQADDYGIEEDGDRQTELVGVTTPDGHVVGFLYAIQ